MEDTQTQQTQNTTQTATTPVNTQVSGAPVSAPTSSTPSTSEKKYKVFIIDDDKFLLDMYSMKFVERQFAVEVAFGSMEALEKLKGGTKPDIILLDIVMPNMDGFELLQEIKNQNLAAEAVIIILSNLGQKEDIERGLKLGADGYIIKASSTPTEVVNKVLEIAKPKAGPTGA
jgi:DNA-binding response OmpR family regulator